jgi:hypothetical protein
LLERGLKPGPRVGEILQTVYARQLAGDVSTLEQAHRAVDDILGERN